MKIKFIAIITVLLSVIILGCVESQPSKFPESANIPETNSPSTPQVTVLITAAPSQMLPTINDMPDGSKKGPEKSNETHAERSFLLFSGATPTSLNYEVNKFPSINEAIDNYNIIKTRYSNNKLNSVKLGDEGFGFVEVDSIGRVIFRKANVVVKVEMVGRYSVSLEETISYAEMVETPTSTFKLVADSKTLTKGETWNIGGGYALKVMTIDQKATPKRVWLELSKNGNKLDDKVSIEGETYIYNDILSTKIDSISDDWVVLKDTHLT